MYNKKLLLVKSHNFDLLFIKEIMIKNIKYIE